MEQNSMYAIDQRVEIPLNKRKIAIMLLGSIAFVAIGVWFVISPPHISNSFWGGTTKLFIVGMLSILFFGFCAVLFARKLVDKGPGLIIDDKGITDNSGGNSAGLILWSDVVAIDSLSVHNQKFVMLVLANPEEYIDRQASAFKKRMMKMNYKAYGTPINISVNSLAIKHDELMDLLVRKLDQSKSALLE